MLANVGAIVIGPFQHDGFATVVGQALDISPGVQGAMMISGIWKNRFNMIFLLFLKVVDGFGYIAFG
jgi:hypothetical protein